MNDLIAYSSTTGDAKPFISAKFESHEEVLVWDSEPFCFVCSRCTDHFAEHDDLVEAGTAKYAADGTVYSIERTPWQFEAVAA